MGSKVAREQVLGWQLMEGTKGTMECWAAFLVIQNAFYNLFMWPHHIIL